MAVTSVTELAGRDASFDDENKREYRRTYQVITNDKTDGAIEVMSNILIPRLYSSYFLTGGDFDTGARVTRITPRQDADYPFRWEVDVQYSTKSADGDREDESPLLRPAEISMAFETSMEVIAGTFKNAPNAEDIQYTAGLTNSAGELFDPPAEREVSRPVLTITRNEHTINPRILMEFADAVNFDYFLGAQPRQLKMSSPSFVRQHENNNAFWRVTYQMKYNKDTWDVQLLNIGSRYKDGSGDLQPKKDNEGNRILTLLTSTGGELAAGADHTFNRFLVFEEKQFSTLGLEQSISL